MSLKRFLVGATIGSVVTATLVLKLTEKKDDFYRKEVDELAEDLQANLENIFEQTEKIKQGIPKIKSYIDEVAKPIFEELKDELAEYQRTSEPRIDEMEKRAANIQSKLDSKN
ncbi:MULTISPECIES: hypothetical protein [unclassified Enterococcus]|uniref:hypothetical protein n=1 Tax=unclassified Enterococcus TaxID=2608891 RepID=UPI0015536799|nr:MULTISPECIES: hypothetical protein [unclassified Enterococcus]MBS7576518.1 hypothetical protein [Enterococcus sp. MMGLQ5-2]MBS7583995.1 hypothetical protein [Enterococcus sp. MMGLQ5-1]NPD11856.1 hypothetical protein [Enterococcus sp. MMGLQ5-1]NPD36355.1 hypothetical protein [Enterococcus sp. MMGLQ5-2]